MQAIPIELKDANAFVDRLHRHHDPVYRDKFRLACLDDEGHMCGVIQAGRPVARHLDDGKTIEVVRCCTDGTYNACSFLYSRIARIAKEMGYHKIITYILNDEGGLVSRLADGIKKLIQKVTHGIVKVDLAKQLHPLVINKDGVKYFRI